MATFKVVLDKRVEKKDEKFNLAVRVSNGGDIMYINLQKMTGTQYERVFVKKSMDPESIKFRATCDQYITKCEEIFSKLKPYNKVRFRELFWEQDREKPDSLLLRDLFDYHIKNNDGIKIKTKNMLRGTSNVLETFKKDISVGDIAPALLKRFEKKKMEEGCSRATVDSYLRNLRRIINYFSHEVKLIPEQYKYPFGQGGYSISSYFPHKVVLTEKEIRSIIEMTEFESDEEKYARDIFLMSYYCNGCNFVDLLRMRWSQRIGTYIIFIRKKTETTRKNNIKDLVIPVDEKLQAVLDRVGDKSSPFILGLISEGYTESSFENRNHKLKGQINGNLAKIGKRLKLSTPLNLSKARDCYASTLMRNGTPIHDIGEGLGHGDVKTTEHYLTSLDAERMFEINSSLL